MVWVQIMTFNPCYNNILGRKLSVTFLEERQNFHVLCTTRIRFTVASARAWQVSQLDLDVWFNTKRKKDINTCECSLGWSHQHKTILRTAGGQHFSSVKAALPKSFSLLSISPLSSISPFCRSPQSVTPQGATGTHSRGLGSLCLPITHTHTPLYLDFLLSPRIYCTLSHTSPFALLEPLNPPKIY